MKPQTLIFLLLSIIFILQPVTALAFETDQYNLPPVPLADIGDEVSEYIEETLRAAVAKVNADIVKRMACLDAKPDKKTVCLSREKEIKNLADLRSSNTIVREFYNLTGDGSIFISKFGKWMNSHEFRVSPSRYKTTYHESIFIALPSDYLTISPTVKLFGAEFGIDKLDHFMQQGYKYYKIEKDAVASGMSAQDAVAKAVRWGQRTERTYFGMLVSGVYSNADLYANYAGMRFYQGFTQPVAIGDKMRPAIATIKDGIWEIEESGLREKLLKPFMTDHLNEALNPSGYAFNLFPSVRRIVKKYACPEWRTLYPTLSATALADRSKALELWYGQDYGYTKKDRSVRIGETCFAAGVPAG